MYRGTTPTHKFNLPIHTNLISEIRITYAQGDRAVLTKRATSDEATAEYANSVVFKDKTVLVSLSEEDTLKFTVPPCGKREAFSYVKVQIKVKTKGNEVLASNIITLHIKEILDPTPMG